MTTIPNSFPIRYTEFATGEFVGITWMPFADTDYDVIEDRAAFHAKMRGVEIDIETGSVFPSGRVGSWDRIGIRVRPS